MKNFSNITKAVLLVLLTLPWLAMAAMTEPTAEGATVAACTGDISNAAKYIAIALIMVFGSLVASLCNKNNNRNFGILYNNNASNSFTFSGTRNRRYEKLSENELNIKKNKDKFIDIIEQNFLANFIKKHNIDIRSKVFAKDLLTNSLADSAYLISAFGVSDISKLTVSEQINYKVFYDCILTKIPILEDDIVKFVANSEFYKSDGSIHDTWFSKI